MAIPHCWISRALAHFTVHMSVMHFTGSQMRLCYYYYGGLLDHRGSAHCSHSFTSGFSISGGGFVVS